MSVDVLSETVAAMRTGRPRSVLTEARAPWGLRFQPRAGASFHVVLEGTCWFMPAQGRPLPLGPGDVVFLRSGSGHGLADRPTTPLVEFRPEQVNHSSPIGRLSVPGTGERAALLCGAYQLERARPHPLLISLPETVHLPCRPGQPTALRSAVELLRSELRDYRPGGDAIVSSLVDGMLVYVLREWLHEQPRDTAEGWAVAIADPATAGALRNIHRDPGRPWTVDALAEDVGLSRAAFSRRFTAQVGEPPLTYLTRWRMTTAGRLLHESGLPLGRVAQQVGYTSSFAFAKAFKREYGIAPGGYRKLAREDTGADEHSRPIR
ncbi:AraC family transcriptional regulator [Actinocrispum wychmicini]|uniref:AraC-like DNA-binding protein n=1 Tax=Actinocrispum wychmicini TaxID=1213861 RepID=A0A4R2JY45_9PSEU|nr:AraC family transcriptional regulator [Actinocrispum wychmicini]TCO62296.1 AraC-like DNA-binding protein [Actinocrispum wychmicini]